MRHDILGRNIKSKIVLNKTFFLYTSLLLTSIYCLTNSSNNLEIGFFVLVSIFSFLSSLNSMLLRELFNHHESFIYRERCLFPIQGRTKCAFKVFKTSNAEDPNFLEVLSRLNSLQLFNNSIKPFNYCKENLVQNSIYEL